MWDLHGEAEEHVLEDHTDPVNEVAVTTDSERLISTSDDCMLKEWDLRSGTAIQTLKGHTDLVKSVAITTDDKRAVSASYDRTFKVYNLRSGAEEHSLRGRSKGVNAVAVTPDGTLIVAGDGLVLVDYLLLEEMMGDRLQEICIIRVEE